MQARRTISHGPEGGWSAIAVHIAAAEGGKEGFYLSLFPDSRGPSVVFLRPQQLLDMVELAASSPTSEQAVWDLVARIPMEPLLPSRSLAVRLRTLLADFGAVLREQARAQLAKATAPPPSPTFESAEGSPRPEDAQEGEREGFDPLSPHYQR